MPLLLTAAAACLLPSCQSALYNDSAMSSKFSEKFTQSLVLRAALEADVRHPMPTRYGGVREYPRVDSNGLDPAMTAPSTGAATGPAAFAVNPTTYPTDDITGIPNKFTPTDPLAGLRPAQLDMVEGTIDISLQEALARAMKHNLDILVESYNPAIKALQTIEAETIFDPVLFGQHQLNNVDQPAQIASSIRGLTFSNTVGVRELLPTGGTVQASIGDTYSDLNPAIGFGGTTLHGHAANLNLSIAQPLLRGAGPDVTYANIYLAQRDHSISLAQFRRRVIQVCADVEEAYHNLVLATASVRIQEQLLADTDASRKRVWDRKDIDVDAVQYNQALSAVESRRAELILARSALRTASDRLKGLINDRELDLRANDLLVPSDRPTSEPTRYNVAEVIDTALRQRTEVQEARLQIERADIVVNATKNDLLPRVDANGSIQSNGGFYENDFVNGIGSTLDGHKYIDYGIGVKWEWPIGNTEAEARYQRRMLERRQALTNLLSTAQKVVVDVKTQLREVYKTYEEIGARESARVATARELNGLIKKEAIVPLTPEFLRLKLDAQQRLASAEISEIQAMVNYNIAISKLEQGKGTLLEYNHVAINAKPVETPLQKLWLIGQSIQWENPFEKKSEPK